MHVWVFCRAFVEAHGDYVALVCEACNIRLGSQVWRHVKCAKFPVYQNTSYGYTLVALLTLLASATAGMALLT